MRHPLTEKFLERTRELEVKIYKCKNPHADIDRAYALLQQREDLRVAFLRIGIMSEWQLTQALHTHNDEAISAQLDKIYAENDRLQLDGLHLDNEISKALHRWPPREASAAANWNTQRPLGMNGQYEDEFKTE